MIQEHIQVGVLGEILEANTASLSTLGWCFITQFSKHFISLEITRSENRINGTGCVRPSVLLVGSIGNLHGVILDRLLQYIFFGCH